MDPDLVYASMASKKASPRSVLDSVMDGLDRASPRYWGKGSARAEQYARFEDEVDDPWIGGGHSVLPKPKPQPLSSRSGAQSSRRPSPGTRRRERRTVQGEQRYAQVAPRLAAEAQARQAQMAKLAQAKAAALKLEYQDAWVIEKLKHLHLKVTVDKVTHSEDYATPKDKHLDALVAGASSKSKAKAMCKMITSVLGKCSAGSLTSVDDCIRIIKACFAMHVVMKRGTAEAFANTIGKFPNMFNLPQLDMPSSIPAACVEAKIAIAYASYLNVMVTHKRLAGAEAQAAGARLVELFDAAIKCRFYRKRDLSSYFERDVVHMFQLQIISDLVGLADDLEAAFERQGRGPEAIAKRKKLLCSWAERMQARKYLPDAEYRRLAALATPAVGEQ